MPKPQNAERFLDRVGDILWSAPSDPADFEHHSYKRLIDEAYNRYIIGMSQDEAEAVEEVRIEDDRVFIDELERLFNEGEIYYQPKISEVTLRSLR